VPAAPDITASPTPSRRRKGELTAERILDVAEAIFAERGYAGATLRDVAAEVGLRTPSLYNHFPSKESLYAAVLERGISPVLDVLTEVVEARDRSDRDVRQIVDRTMNLVGRRPELPRLIQQETLSGGRHLTPMLREWVQRTFARAYEMVEASSAASRWEPDQFPLLVLAMYHVFVGYFAIAHVYKDLNGQDLLSQQALAKQTRFFGDLVAALFEEEGARQGR
jgi:AcrR family transcriptional regulator